MNDIPHQIYRATEQQATAIWDNLINGNKSTARAMFNQSMDKRKGMITLMLCKWSRIRGTPELVERFIVSVTE